MCQIVYVILLIKGSHAWGLPARPLLRLPPLPPPPPAGVKHFMSNAAVPMSCFAGGLAGTPGCCMV